MTECGVPLVGLTVSAVGPPSGAAPEPAALTPVELVGVVVVVAELVAPAPGPLELVVFEPAQPQDAAHRAARAAAIISRARPRLMRSLGR
jgi:hypothetical protein